MKDKNEGVDVAKISGFRYILTFIPGFGQFMNQQKGKGSAFLGIFTFLFLVLFVRFNYILPRMFNINKTIGFEAGISGDNSLYILIEFVILIYVSMLFIYFIYLVHKDAINTNKYILENGVIPNLASDWQTFKEKSFVIMILFPAYLLATLFIVVPITITILISFTNYNFINQPPNSLISWVGFDNYIEFLAPTDSGIQYQEVFLQVLRWTIVWTVLATTLQIILGTIVAFVFNQEDLKGAKYLMPLFLLTWAIPGFVLWGMFSQMYADSTGIINAQLLPMLNTIMDPFIINGDLYTILEKIAEIGMTEEQKESFEIAENTYGVMEVPWKSNVNLTKLAIIMIQPLLGFPYVFTVVLGSLKSIPQSLYQAADIDGASVFQKLKKITLPILVVAILPVLITQYTFNFNNFGAIYLFNAGGPGELGAGAGSTDILISWIYGIMLGTSPDYGLAAAISIIMSLFTITVSLFVFLRSNTFAKEDMM